MVDDRAPASGEHGTATTPGPAGGGPWLHVRREPFEFGLLPIPSLVFKENAVDALKSLRARLLEARAAESSEDASMTEPNRINAKALAFCTNIPEVQARLVIDTLASVLPTDNPDDVDLLAQAPVGDVDSVGADVDHLVLYLFLQSYKRTPHRAVFRDAAVMADVWPQGPSPFDNVSPTAASALQLKTSLAARQRSLPGQAEEELHQLAYVQKHLSLLLALLTDKNEAGEEVISIDKFDLLGLLLRVGRVGTPTSPLSSVAPFFANSDPAMPAAPVPLAAALEWFHGRVCYTSDHGPDMPPVSPRTGAGSSSPGPEVSMMDAGADGSPEPLAQPPATPGGTPIVVGSALLNGVISPKRAWAGAGVTNVDGVAKMSVLKQDHDVENGSIRIAHCHDSVIYILAPLKYASIIGCSDSIVVLGPAGKAVRVETCERVQLIAPCARIRIANCRESVFYLGTNSSPVVFGDNHNIQIAPYNTFYPKLDYHLAKTGVSPSTNRWDDPHSLGSVDPHDLMPAPAGSSSSDSERAALLPPEKFAPFVVPFRGPTDTGGASPLLHQQTRTNPFQLPKPYLQALQQKTKTVETIRQTLKTAVLEESKKKELTNVIQAHFKEWLLTSGNIRQIYDLARLDRDS